MGIEKGCLCPAQGESWLVRGISDTCFYPPLECLGMKWHHHFSPFPSWEKGDGVNPALERSLTMLQHRGSSMPGLSPGSVSSGTPLCHPFPLVSFSRLHCSLSSPQSGIRS